VGNFPPMIMKVDLAGGHCDRGALTLWRHW
jgi:hypothetical protein